MKRNLVAIVILFTLFSVAQMAGAAELAGVTLPNQVKVADHDLALNGIALRSKYMFKVYVAGLYLPAKTGSWQKVLADDAPRHMVMHWVRSVGKEKICDGWMDGLEANTPNPSAEVKKGFDTLCAWMEDVRAGDSFTFTYLPGEGTRVSVKGLAKGTIAGKAFADALFACWIGPHPDPGEDFREALMGRD